jgi:hypothetical protein
MHRRIHNLVLSAVMLAIPASALSAPMSKLKTLPGFIAAVGAVYATNAAMLSAAENPMDDSRREAVRKAIAAMPAAIIALAMEFKNGNLHDADYPAIAAMLGGFVDVNAGDNYKKFLQKPNRSAIPKTGAGFPSDLARSGPAVASAPAAYGPQPASGAVGSAISAASAGVLPGGGAIPANQVANLGAASAVPQAKTAPPAASFSYDNSSSGNAGPAADSTATKAETVGSAARDAASAAGEATAAVTELASPAAPAAGSNSFLRQVNSELAGI